MYLLHRYAKATIGARDACTVYGAAQKLQKYSLREFSNVERLYCQHYSSALSKLRDDLEDVNTNRWPVLVTALLLCLSELLLRRRLSALKHLYAVLGMAGTILQPVRSRNQTCPNPSPSILDPKISLDLHLLFYIMDIHMLSYSGGTRLATMKAHPFHVLARRMEEACGDERTLADIVHTIHSSYAFIASIAHNAASGRQNEDEKHVRDKALALVIQCISYLDCISSNVQAQRQSILQLRILKNFCIALAILLRNLFEIDEYSWTKDDLEFQDIISSAEEILNLAGTPGKEICKLPDTSMTPTLGMIPPLFLAALKYRNPMWRRRAIQCLRLTGLEGPWNGAMCAAVAQRCMEIEESTLRCNESEMSLISICFAADNDGESDGQVWPSSVQGTFLMRIFQRVKPVPFVNGLWLSSSHVSKETVDVDVYRSFLEHWQYSCEKISFGSGAK